LRLNKEDLVKHIAPLAAPLVKQVRQATPLIAEQCKIYMDLARTLIDQKPKHQTTVDEQMLKQWALEARQKIDLLVRTLTADIGDPLDLEIAQSELTDQLTRALAGQLVKVGARKMNATFKRIFAAGLVGLAVYALYRMLQNGEKVEDAQKRLSETDNKSFPPKQ